MALNRHADVFYAPTVITAAKPIQPSIRKTVVLSADERIARVNRSRDRNETLKNALQEFEAYAIKVADELAEKCGRKREHYLRMLFTGGVSVQKRRKVNPYNAWSHQLAKELNDDDDDTEEGSKRMNLMDLQRDRKDEYDKLTPQQKRELVNELQEDQNSRNLGIRLNQRGRSRDVKETCAKIEAMLEALKCRVGVEAFYCVVRNNNEFHMPPRWYFTNEKLDRYLAGTIKKWDIENVGAMTEAFSIAGCDAMMFLRTAKDRAEWIKNEIRDKVNTLLATITGKPNIVMQYKSYEKDIVLQHGVELVGWTHEVFACPSNLPMAIDPLRALLDALDDGDCYFRKLTSTELAKRQEEYDRKVKEGAVPARKSRSDKGKKRKAYRKKQDAREDGDDEDEDMEEVQRRKRPREAEAGPSGDGA